MQVNDSIYAFVHFEGPLPSQLFYMELSQDALGMLKIIRQKVRFPLSSNNCDCYCCCDH